MADDVERRKVDEAFKFRIVESQAEIKALLSAQNSTIKGLEDATSRNSMAIAEVRFALWGGPKESDVGLIEKHRRLARNWTIVVSVCAFVFSALGKIASPLWNKLVADWVYNSPSMKWEREQQRPRIKRITIRNVTSRTEGDSQEQSQ